MVETLNDVDVTLEHTLFWLVSQLSYNFGQQDFAISCNMWRILTDCQDCFKSNPRCYIVSTERVKHMITQMKSRKKII